MNSSLYLVRELAFRRGRSIATATSIALSVLIAVLLTALASTFAGALKVPMKSVGADVVVQLSGDIPKKLEGLVFPHPNALLPASMVERIKATPGVVSITRGVYIWELAPDHYQSVLGLEAGPNGLALLNARVIEGKALAESERAALLDSDFAKKNNLRAGSQIVVGPEKFPVAGIVDAASGGKVVRADVYLPLKVAQELSASAPQVVELYPFTTTDVNLLLVKVDQRELENVVAAFNKIVGSKAVISSELSFRDTLDSVLFLSEKLGLILAGVVAFFAAAFVLRATVSAVNERRREMAVLQAVGWPWRAIRRQIIAENTVLAVIGTCIGLVLAASAAYAIGSISVTMELPWDLSSTPHFLPDATMDRRQIATVPVELPWQLLLMSGVGGVAVGIASAILALSGRRSQPWPLLRGE